MKAQMMMMPGFRGGARKRDGIPLVAKRSGAAVTRLQEQDEEDEDDDEDEEADDEGYASLVRRCRDRKDLSQGRRLHAHLSKKGRLRHNTRLANLLIHMYAKCGCLDDARAVFDGICVPNLFSWNIMITVYAQRGGAAESEEALALFGRMGFAPDKYTFIPLLSACSAVKSLEQGKRVHDALISSGLFPLDVEIGNALVNMYGKCGSFADARAAFDSMRAHDVISWTSLIAAYARAGLGAEALCTFHEMRVHGVTPTKTTFLNILGACSSPDFLDSGREIHRQAIANGCNSHPSVASALVTMYGKCGSLRDARAVFDQMPPCRDVVSWTTMITAYARKGHSLEAIELFSRMESEGVKPDRIAFLSALDVCSNSASLDACETIHKHISSSEFRSDVAIVTALLSAYGKCGNPRKARAVFDEMRQRNTVSWTAMITAYAHNKHYKEALCLFRQMLSLRVKPTNITFLAALDACVGPEYLEYGKVIHKEAASAGFLPDDMPINNALINMYHKCGSLDDAKSTFDAMTHRDVISWTTLIAAYVRNGFAKEALELFRNMDLQGVHPTKVTFLGILDACASSASLESGRAVHKLIAASGLESDSALTTALLNMYSKCGSLTDSRAIFGQTHESDIVLWTAMIEAYGQNGRYREALKHFRQMELEGVRPDMVTFLVILNICNHSGSLDDGWHYFHSMRRKYGMIPLVDHYVCMVDLLGRAGCLAEAEDMLINMSVLPDVVAWTTFLGACRVHGDVERGARAAKRVFEVDPQNTSAYILLSNIYAAARRWDDVAKVRNAMAARGLKKLPGCSWIEVDGTVHGFFTRDTSHPQSDKIYTELERLNKQMREAGYVPHTKEVFHDVDEDVKEQMLCYHSEKLAIAFGVLNTPPGTPLRIIKNLRVCPDCHAAIKLISRIAKREIVVRDCNQFHYFNDGTCSCGDYW